MDKREKSCTRKMKKYIKNITKGMGIFLNDDVINRILIILLSSINIYNGDVCEIIDLFAVFIIPHIKDSLKLYREQKGKRRGNRKQKRFNKRQSMGASIKRTIFHDENTTRELCIMLNFDYKNFHEFLYKFFKKSIKHVAKLAKRHLKNNHKIICSFNDDLNYILFEHFYRSGRFLMNK